MSKNLSEIQFLYDAIEKDNCNLAICLLLIDYLTSSYACCIGNEIVQPVPVFNKRMDIKKYSIEHDKTKLGSHKTTRLIIETDVGTINISLYKFKKYLRHKYNLLWKTINVWKP